MDRGVSQATVQGVTKSWTGLRATHTHTHTHTHTQKERKEGMSERNEQSKGTHRCQSNFQDKWAAFHPSLQSY